PVTTRAKVWLLDPDCAYTVPMEDDLTLALVAPHRDRLPEFRADLDGTYRRMLNSLPDAPEFGAATLESKLLGKLDVPNVFRPAARPGVAFVGDAALAADPVWGVGCGWALQSAEWLAEETGDALDSRSALAAALERIAPAPRAFERPLAPVTAWKRVSDWLAAPVAWIPEPGPRYAPVLGQLIAGFDVRGNLIPDATRAALAIEHGLTLYSTDT